MRKLLTFVFISFSIILIGQTDLSEVYEIADQMPYFPGCNEYSDGSADKQNCSNINLVTYISDHLNYPKKARIEGIEGTVYLSFIITENGKIIQPKIIRDIGGGCGDVALQIVKDMPTWEPGKLKNEPVKVQLNLPVKFSLKNTRPETDSEIRIAWGNLTGSLTSKEHILKNLENDLVIRDLAGNSLDITRLIFANKKKSKIKEAESRGEITPKMKKLIKKLKKGNEFAVICTVHHDGRLVDVERIFQIIE